MLPNVPLISRQLIGRDLNRQFLTRSLTSLMKCQQLVGITLSDQMRQNQFRVSVHARPKPKVTFARFGLAFIRLW